MVNQEILDAVKELQAHDFLILSKKDGPYTVQFLNEEDEEGPVVFIDRYGTNRMWMPLDVYLELRKYMNDTKREVIEYPKREVIEYPKDTSDAINAVANHVYNVAKISGFHGNDGEIGDLKNGRFGEFCSNLHGEVSELWEAYRKGKLHQQCDKPVELSCAEEEISDIIIRCFDTAVTLGIDIGRAIMMKDSYNQTRPYKHGDKRA
jgi:NTP pyrophosphatase (non-canonical NTP hydrolase)